MSDDLDLDFDRAERMGFPEIVYAEGKSVDQLQRIVAAHRERGAGLLATRVRPDQAEVLTDGTWDAEARTWTLPPGQPQRPGCVGLISGGTSDRPVLAEAANTLAFLGIQTLRIEDAGVAGPHRLPKRRAELDACDALIVFAGFEAALASVAAALFPQPIIGVPTSVGYGVAANGHAALNAMLASCANGLTVMNIDNGCGAALAASRILKTIQ